MSISVCYICVCHHKRACSALLISKQISCQSFFAWTPATRNTACRKHAKRNKYLVFFSDEGQLLFLAGSNPCLVPVVVLEQVIVLAQWGVEIFNMCPFTHSSNRAAPWQVCMALILQPHNCCQQY